MASQPYFPKFNTRVLLCGRSPSCRASATRWPWPKPHLASSHQWQFRECASQADEPLIESAPRDQSFCDSFLTVYYTMFGGTWPLGIREQRSAAIPQRPSFPKHRILLNCNTEAETLSDLLALSRLTFSIGTVVCRLSGSKVYGSV